MTTRLRLLAVVVVTVSGMLAFGATAATASPPAAAPNGVAEMLKANPGSVRVDEYSVLLKTGLRVTVPNGEVGPAAATQCLRGWACIWVDANFAGPIAQIREGHEVWMRDYWYYGNTVVFSPGIKPGPLWQNFYRKVSSVFNNSNNLRARFHAEGVGHTHVGVGEQRPFVGELYNDRFDIACICVA